MISKNSSVDPTIPTSITISISSNKAFRQILWQHRPGLERRRGGWFLAPLPSSKDISSKNVIEKKVQEKIDVLQKISTVPRFLFLHLFLQKKLHHRRPQTVAQIANLPWNSGDTASQTRRTQHPSRDGRQGRRQEKDKTRKADTAKADTHKIALRTPTVNCLGKKPTPVINGSETHTSPVSRFRKGHPLGGSSDKKQLLFPGAKSKLGKHR